MSIKYAIFSICFRQINEYFFFAMIAFFSFLSLFKAVYISSVQYLFTQKSMNRIEINMEFYYEAYGCNQLDR